MDLFVFSLLLTTFCLLVAALYLSQYLEFQWKRNSPETNKELFLQWINDHWYRLPSEHKILSLINEQAKQVTPVHGGEQWSGLSIEGLLSGTVLPSFQIKDILAYEQDKLHCQVLIEWPDCLPGLEVSVNLNGERIVCHLQVDWMILEGDLMIVPVSEDGALLSWKQTGPPSSAMSCLVVSPEKWKANFDIMKPVLVEGDRETEASENLSSSVTEGVLSLLGSFELKNVPLPLHTHPAEEEEKEKEEMLLRLVEEGEVTTEEVMKVEVEEMEEEQDEELGAKEGMVYEVEVKERTTNKEVMFGIYNENDEKKTNEEKASSLNTAMVTSHSVISTDPIFTAQKTTPTTNTTPAPLAMTTPTTNKPLTSPEASSESPPIVKQKTSPKTPPKTPPIVRTSPIEREAPLITEATPIETEAPPTSTALGNGSVLAKPYHWLGELPVISEPKEEEEEEEEEEEGERIKSSLPINRTESPSTWRRSDSYENFQVTDLMPQISPSPLLHSATPPLTRPPVLRSYQSTPPPRPHSAQRNYPALLKIAQSEEDLLNESDEQKRKKRRQMTLSVRSYDTDTPVTTGRLPSMLVYEVEEGTQRRHIVALNTFHATKLRKQLPSYTKLHIYNDHTFTATHIKGRQLCGVCSDKVTGLFGKQCYICRDCSLIVHKECHFKVEFPCPKSKVSKMCLIDPDRLSSISQY